jgi:hypothetical protein
MPTESRILAFSKHEVFEALRDYCSNTGLRLPDDSLAGLALLPTREVTIALNHLGHESAINFTENEVGAALILFCVKKNIPVARRAVKSLEVTGETLSLHLTLC